MTKDPTKKSQSPILYSFRRCPYAMRARMALYYSQQDFELREVVLKQKPPEMLAASSKGTVPVLVLDTGSSKHVIDESLAIMQWALQRYDPESWLIDLNGVALAEKHPLIERNDHYFTYWLTRYKYADRFPQADQLDYFEKCRVFLQELDNALVSGDSQLCFINSPQLSLVDVATFPFVRQCFAVDDKLTNTLEFERLKAWHDHLIRSDLFINIMPKYPMWTAQQSEIIKLGVRA